MGERFYCLATPVQQFHRLYGRHELHGEVQVDAPVSMVAKLLARILGIPFVTGKGSIKFEIDARPLTETWIRHFPSNVLTTQLQLQGSHLVEKVGAARLTFELSERNGQLHLHLRRLQFVGIPCPEWLMPIIVAEEMGNGDRLYFHISVAVRLVGTIARYRGYLLLPVEGKA
jgi:hypothetical protein